MTYPTATNISGVGSVFRYANEVSNNIFGPGILLSLYIIIFLYLKARGEEAVDCFVVAGFITAIGAIFFFLMELINQWHLFIAILTVALPILWAYWHRD